MVKSKKIEIETFAEPIVQPESPQHEGIDPLAEGGALLPTEDTRAESEKLRKKENKPVKSAKKSPTKKSPAKKPDTVEAVYDPTAPDTVEATN